MNLSKPETKTDRSPGQEGRLEFGQEQHNKKTNKKNKHTPPPK